MSAASADTEAFVLLALAVFIILLRLYFRLDLVGFKKLQFDDYLMLMTGVRTHKYCLCFSTNADVFVTAHRHPL